MTLYTAEALILIYRNYVSTEGNLELMERNIRK